MSLFFNLVILGMYAAIHCAGLFTLVFYDRELTHIRVLKAFRVCSVDVYFLILYSLSAGSRLFECAKPPHDVH